MGKDNCKTRRDTFKFGDSVRLILEILSYMYISDNIDSISVLLLSFDIFEDSIVAIVAITIRPGTLSFLWSHWNSFVDRVPVDGIYDFQLNCSDV